MGQGWVRAGRVWGRVGYGLGLCMGRGGEGEVVTERLLSLKAMKDSPGYHPCVLPGESIGSPAGQIAPRRMEARCTSSKRGIDP